MKITYHNMTVDYNMKLENFTLLLDFNTISMGSASVESDIILNLDKPGSKAADTVKNYFNWAFMLIVPWANEYKPEWVSSFPIPREIPGYMKINDISLEIKENYLSYSIDPEFIPI